MLIVTTSGADSYEWLIGGVTIAGETDDSLTVSTSGLYSCIISYGNCDDTTIVYDLSILDCSGIEELNGLDFAIYP